MRLEPIEKPRGLILRIAYWMSRRTLGAVMSSIKVIYARAPKLGLGRFAALLDYETSEAFSEREIVEITWLNALGHFFNLMAVPLQLESDDLLLLALERGA
jgi:hypothetical protein